MTPTELAEAFARYLPDLQDFASAEFGSAGEELVQRFFVALLSGSCRITHETFDDHYWKLLTDVVADLLVEHEETMEQGAGI